MKKAVFSLIIAAFMVGACTQSNPADKIIGTWINQNGEIEFKKDGTFRDGGTSQKISYTISGNNLELSVGGRTQTYTFSLKGNTLTLTKVGTEDTQTLTRK